MHSIRALLLLGVALACRGTELATPVPTSEAPVGRPVRVTVVSGDDQRGTVGQPRPADIVVLVQDSAGRPVPEVPVALIDTLADPFTGKPSIRAIAMTVANGRATFARPAFGSRAGAQTFAIRLVADSSTQTFVQASAAVGAPQRIEVLCCRPGYATGTLVLDPNSFTVLDQYGNAVSGVPVEFSVGPAGGTVSGTSKISDAAGHVAPDAWTLGSQTGSYELILTAGALVRTVRADAYSGPPARIDFVSISTTDIPGPEQQVFAGGTLASRIFVNVVDATGRWVPGATVRWMAEGGTSCTSLTGTFFTYAESCVFQLGPSSGTQRITVSSDAATATFTVLAREPVQSVEFIEPFESRAVFPATTTAYDLSVKVTLNGGAPAVGYIVLLSNEKTATAFGMTDRITTDSRGVASTRRALQGTVPVRPDAATSLLIVAKLEGASAPADTTTIVISGPLTFRQIAAGGSHTCARTYYEVYCWGRNAEGQLGDGTLTPRLTPVPVPFKLLSSSSGVSVNVIAVTAGRSHSCAVDFTTQQIGRGPGVIVIPRTVCWGANGAGQVGIPATTPSISRPVAASIQIGAPAAGVAHSCGLNTVSATSGVWCWGDNRFGALGDGTLVSRSVPAPVVVSQLGTLVNSVATGDGFSCAINVTGVAYCWGHNDQGQLGDGSRTDRLAPTLVSPTLFFDPARTIVTGDAHACALTTAGQAYCWGRNTDGQLGDGTTTSRVAPTPVGGGIAFVALAAGGAHTCGVTSANDAYCWGANESGQLGSGTGAVALVPQRVSGSQKFRAISAGRAHTCALVPAPFSSLAGDLGFGIPFCWGANSDGQLGDGTTVNRLTPIRVSDFR